jgi:uncharacterized protein
MYIRDHAKKITDRINEPVSRLIVVTGPRQIGKTTLVRKILERDRSSVEYNYLAVDEPILASPYDYSTSQTTTAGIGVPKPDIEWLTVQWEKARKIADDPDNKRGYILILDEIQKIPQWSDAVKGLWDADRAVDRPLRVILLGSAPLLMQQGLNETLTGRYELIRMTHWSFMEMSQAFDLDLPRYVYFGGYPGAAQYINDQPRWVDYVRSALIDPNIEKDIFMMTRVDKPALLKQLFELGCHYSGRELSLTKMKGQLENAGNETTLAGYLDLLTKAGLLIGLQKFANQQHRRRASPPKLNVLNTALMTAMSGYTYEEARADRTFWGRLVESTVGSHLYNMGFPDCRLYYWRDGNNEVDFVIERGNKRVAIEVKSSPSDGSRRGLELFSERFETHRSILVGGQGEPLEIFLSTGPDDWFGEK